MYLGTSNSWNCSVLRFYQTTTRFQNMPLGQKKKKEAIRSLKSNTTVSKLPFFSVQQNCYCTGNLPEEPDRVIKCTHCKFSTDFEPVLSVHLFYLFICLISLPPVMRPYRGKLRTFYGVNLKKVKNVNLAVSKILGRSS